MAVICGDLIKYYTKWLNDKAEVSRIDDNICSVVLPFLRPDNDCIELKLKMENGNVVVSDGGETYDYLFINGIDIDNSPKRLNYINMTAERLGLKFNGFEIYGIAASMDDVPKVINNVVLAVKDISCLIYTAVERSKATFKEEVEFFLRDKGIKFSSNYKIKGFSEEHVFDFVVETTKTNVIEPLSAGSTSYAHILAERTAYKFSDVRRNNVNITSIAFINDEDDVWTKETHKILSNYSDFLLSWSERDKLPKLLVA